MSAPAPAGVADITARINEIQSRFGMRTPALGAAQRSQDFGQALAAATLDGTSGVGSLLDDGTGSVTGADGASGSSVVADATRYLGVPYQWGGTDPSSGLDCSGLVQRVYKDLGVDLPRVAADQAKMGQPVASLADAQPGDLVAFGSPVDHIGIYAGKGKMVVAPKTGDVVKVQDIAPRTPTAIRRIVGTSSSARTGAFDPAALRVSLAGATASGALGLGSTSSTSSSSSSGLGDTPYGDLFAAAGARHGVDPKLLAAVARAESGFDPKAVSGAGALGLMQIMPSTAQSLGVNPLDPAQAVDGAARILAGNLSRFGSVPLAVAAYNAGPGAVDKYGGIPPYPETQAYVRRVLSYAGGTPS